MQELVKSLRESRPLVFCIVHGVSSRFVANCLVALGASPLCSSEGQELANFSSKSDAVFLNDHTKPNVTRSMLNLLQGGWHDPIVLDPVGASISSIIREAVLKYLSTGAVWILRGNASEINQLVKFDKDLAVGVDSADVPAREQGLKLAQKYNCPIWISGAEDYLIAPSGEVRAYSGGSHFMARVSGTGCAVTAILAAFLGVAKERENTLEVASEVIKLVNHASASADTSGTGSFATSFIDILSNY